MESFSITAALAALAVAQLKNCRFYTDKVFPCKEKVIRHLYVRSLQCQCVIAGRGKAVAFFRAEVWGFLGCFFFSCRRKQK